MTVPRLAALSRLERLSEQYGEHHRRVRSRDFVFGGADRAEPIRRAVGGPGKVVLDVGCRDGALTRAYIAGNELVGLDVDREALADAAELGIRTVWADAEEPLPFEDGEFDVVVAGEVLEHLREPRRLVAEAARVLRPGGTFVGSVPNVYRLQNRLLFLVGRPPGQDPTHLHLFRPRDVLDLLAGFGHARLEFVAGRLVPLKPRLFANVIVFSARKPG